MQGREDMEEGEMQRRVAALVGLKRHETPGADHFVGLSRAVRFRLEQERRAAEQAVPCRSVAGGGWRGWMSWLPVGSSRWMEPSAWVPTVLAGLVLLTWVLGDSGRTGVAAPGIRAAGIGVGARPLFGQEAPKEAPKVAPIVGVHVRMVVVDSDQVPPGLVVFPPLPAGMVRGGR